MKRSESRKEIILNCEKMERRLVMMHNSRLEEYQIEREDSSPKAGDICLGRIVNLDPLLHAAFVDIGAAKNAFLHYDDMLAGYSSLAEQYQLDIAEKEKEIIKKSAPKSRKTQVGATKAEAESVRRKRKIKPEDIPHIFRPGMEILVQVIKAPISTKGARITTDITIPGRYLVLMPYHHHRGLSTRIEGAPERERLRKIISELELPEGMGVICRTVGEGRKAAFFKRDLNLLLDYWNGIVQEMEKRKAPCTLFTEPNLVDRTIRDFLTEEIDGIVVDNAEARDRIIATMRRVGVPKMANRVKFYNGIEPIFDYYHINEQLKTVFQREVKLPSGGAIVIDETEALIAVDVNSGKSRMAADQPDFILRTNLEAAEEIGRQLRLRNVGGLVVIDFIDMKSPADRDEVCRLMKKLAKEDRAKTKVLPLSQFGLMEMTRQREHESIKHQFYDPCPYCRGTGVVKSPETVSAEIQRKLYSVLRNKKYKNIAVRVFVHPDILNRLKNTDAEHLDELESACRRDLSYRADPELHYESFRVIDADTGEVLN